MTTDTGSFDLHRSFDITPEQLWHLLTDARMREAWGVPDETMVLEMVTEDLRVGGFEQHRCGPAEAPDFEVETRWYRLDGPSDAVFTETLIFGGARAATTLVTYRVAPAQSGCTLDVAVAVSSFDGKDVLAEIQAGWEGGLASLDALVKQQSTS